jgi:tetratricopeptide (TPR) repeat protein
MNLIKNLFYPFAFVLLLMNTSPIHAQTSDEQMALEYMQNHDYDKAVILYEKLYNKNPDQNTYTYYLYCLEELRDMTAAEKLIKKEIKRNPDNPLFIVDLGYLYKQQNQTDKSKQQYDKALKSLPANQGIISITANAFQQKRELDYATETYLQGRKILKGQYAFHFELAEVYYQKQEFQKMLDEYFDAVGESQVYRTSVQNLLQNKLANNDEKGEKKNMVRTTLLRRIQKEDDKVAFIELLTWYFIQEKDFDGALTQAIALDKRFNEGGERAMQIGDLSASNQDYDIAIKAYKYVIQKGPSSSQYIYARVNFLNTLSDKITKNDSYTSKDLADLEKDYFAAVNELGKTTATAPLLKGLAHFEAFYLNKTDSAESLLKDVITMQGLSPQFIGECKLELGDILLFKGDIWEATLLYSQVDLDFKHSPLGQEAKFKNAKWYFYKGDFAYAQSMLDILKAATSDLISNDAMDLSLLISDNIEDSVNEALTLYSQADLLLYQNKTDEAWATMDSLVKKFPSSTLIPYVYYQKAKIMKRRNKPTEAIGFLQQIVDKYSDGILADDALFDMADMYENRIKDTNKAMELYQQLIIKYPASVFTTEARKRFRTLRGDILN